MTKTTTTVGEREKEQGRVGADGTAATGAVAGVNWKENFIVLFSDV